MKKIIILLMLFVSISFAQNTDKRSRMASEAQTLHDVFENTEEALRIKAISEIIAMAYSSTSTVKLDTLYTASNHWVWLSEIFADTSAIKFLYVMNQDDIANIYLGSDSVNTVKIGAENDFIDAIQWYDSTSTVGIKTDSTNTPIMIYIGK